MKCRIHKRFRLLVIANEKDVHEQFPIPLINRLEKQILGWQTLLTEHLKEVVEKLKKWASNFCEVKIAQHNKMQQFKPSDVFIGYHEDALASIVLRLSAEAEDNMMSDPPVNLVEEAKNMLLMTATPDSMARLSETYLRPEEQEALCEMYFDSNFTNLGQSLEHALRASRRLLFVTTHSRLLTRQGKESLAQSLNVQVKILPLEQINTEIQFAEEISNFLKKQVGPKILLVQYQFHKKEQGSLIDCARYIIQNKLNELPSVPQQCCIAMVLQVRTLYRCR